MGLPVVEYFSVVDYFNGGLWGDDGQRPYFHYAGQIGEIPLRQTQYYDAYGQMVIVREDVSGGWTLKARFDPEFIVNGSASVAYTHDAINNTGWAVGEWNKITGEQKLYGPGYNNHLGWAEINPVTMAWKGTYDYGALFGPIAQLNGTPSGTEGYYGFLSSTYGQFIMFEELGYAVCAMGRPYLGANGGYHGEVMFKVDLSTGQAIETIPITTKYKTTPTAWESPPFMGNSFDLRAMQFVQDGDSSHTAPKGYLFLCDVEGYGYGNPCYRWVKKVDWNPTGASASQGYPERVHCEVRYVSRVLIPHGWPSGINYPQNAPLIVEPISDSLYIYAGEFNYETQGVLDNDLYAQVARISQTPTAANLSPPAFSGRVETNRTIDGIVHLAGDLGEPISGVSIAFSAEKISEKGELLDNNGVGGVVYVDYPPIDELGTTTVYKNGTELTSNWSVTNYTTGEITFVSPEQVGGATYTVDYRHAQNPLSGARVNVLTPGARTSDSGIATCRIRVADDDDLVGEWDQLTATVET